MATKLGITRNNLRPARATDVDLVSDTGRQRPFGCGATGMQGEIHQQFTPHDVITTGRAATGMVMQASPSAEGLRAITVMMTPAQTVL